MLDGWYCRSIANSNAEAEDDEEEEESPDEDLPNYKDQYRNLKRKLKFLIYENECFQESLRSTQRKLLKVNRDKSFLLDRLLQYEKVDTSFSESDDTESSEDETSKVDGSKKRKVDVNVNNHIVHPPPTLMSSAMTMPTVTNNISSTAAANITNLNTNPNAAMIHSPSATIIKPLSTGKKKRSTTKTPKIQNNLPPPPISISIIPSQNNVNTVPMVSILSDGHMTPEEVERHLESRQTYLQLVPEKAPPTVPTEMFSNDPSLDSESNEIGDLETSPNNIGDECLDMMAE